MARRAISWRPIALGAGVAAALGLIFLAAQRRTALIGDSYAVGLGPELKKLVPNFQYEGHVGSSTSQWASGAYGGWLFWYRPSVVLVSLGVNDGPAPNTQNYRKIISWLTSMGAKVIWIQPPANVSTSAHDVISTLSVETVPAQTLPLAPDGLHPTSYGAWAQVVAKAIS